MTITLDEKVFRWARVWAALHDTSVSRFLGRILEERMASEEGYDSAMESFLSRSPERLKDRGRYPDREAIHDRAGLR